jgi:serine/threonine-protein kinase
MAKSPADRPVDARRVQATLVHVAAIANIHVPAEPEEEAPPLSRSPRSAGDPWKRRLTLFERMLARAFPRGAPLEPGRILEAIRAHMAEIERLRASAFEEQQRLEGYEYEGREGRLRLGKAMDALTAEASKTREEARAVKARLSQCTDATKAMIPDVRAVHREIVRWEGRSAFAEPYRELAAAYREAAELIDAWWEARQRELAAEREAAEKDRAIADVNFQIRSLRDSLSNLDRTVGERSRQSQQRVAEMGLTTQRLTGELIQLASRFCAPLRSVPELQPLFLELERVPQ